MERVNKFKAFLGCYYTNLVRWQGEGSAGILPNFELGARDYLKYAELALKSRDSLSLINCVSNLKRAVDCQIDTFFSIINLYDSIKEKNLKVERKLDFIERIGLFSARSLAKLNTIRNKMEHDYSIPDVVEIEFYFELVEALIRSLEMAVTLLMWHSEITFRIQDEISNEEMGQFMIKYKFKQKVPCIHVDWNCGEERESLVISSKEYEVFTYFFKMFFILYQKEYITSKDYIRSMIYG